MKTPRNLLLLLIVLVCAAVLTRCEPETNWHGEVEVAPGEWLPIERAEGRAWFRCQWNGKTVYWGGDYRLGQAGYYDRQFALCLRSWRGGLYLIFVELGPSMNTFKYCKLGPDGTSFDEIKRQDFPRQIATQNIETSQLGVESDVDNESIDYMKVLRSLDVLNLNNTMTGRIWYHLETGLNLEERSATPKGDAAFFTDFVNKYHPIALPTIVR